MTFSSKLLDIIVCPKTFTSLLYDADKQELISLEAHLAYPIKNNIPVLLIDEARALDEQELIYYQNISSKK
ncbi:MAG: Trm112 family protein [Alphaproteobacteria bacterium]|nr:Trm112 family protein [Alphaproteobacteria bacterium]